MARNLRVDISGDPSDFDRAMDEAARAARKLDRELEKTELAQKAQERQALASAAAIRNFGSSAQEAGLKAYKAGQLAEKAAKDAERAQLRAAAAAKAAEKGLISEARAAELAARADEKVKAAALKAAAAHQAQARAADEAADQERQAARAATLSAAAQRLAALKAAGAWKQHNALLGSLEARFGDLSREGSGAFQRIGVETVKAGASISTMGRVAIPAALVGLQLLPAAAAAAGGAISLGLGGALSAVAIKAQASNADVQRSFSAMRKHVVAETRQISAPFHSTLLNISSDARIAFDSLTPSLKHAFGEMAPAVDRFAFNFAASMYKLDPAIQSVGHSFSAVLDSLGPRMPAILGNFATSVKAITDAVAANPDAFADLAEGVSLFARGVGDSIGFLIRFEHEINTVFRTANAFALGPVGILADGALRLKSAFSQAGDGLQIVERTFPSFSQQATIAAARAHQLMTAQAAAALTAQQLKGALDALTGKALTEREALVQYRQSITSMTQALKDNGHAHGFATQKGAQNEAALNQIATAAQSAAVAMRDDGRSAKDVGHFLSGARQRIIAAAEGMGYSSAQAKALATKLLGVSSAANKIPKSKNTKVTADTRTAKSHLDAFLATVNRIPTHRQLTIDVRTNGMRPDLLAGGGYVGRYAEGGPTRRYPTGGTVFGPGTATSDSIPAMLSNGEYVINAAATKRFKPLLDAINYGVRVPARPTTAAPHTPAGGSGKPDISQTFVIQTKDPHVVARESARELAWTLRG